MIGRVFPLAPEAGTQTGPASVVNVSLSENQSWIPGELEEKNPKKTPPPCKWQWKPLRPPIGEKLVPLSGSPTSRLFWQDPGGTCPTPPQAGVGLLPKGSFTNSATSCDTVFESPCVGPKTPVVSKSEGE